MKTRTDGYRYLRSYNTIRDRRYALYEVQDGKATRVGTADTEPAGTAFICYHDRRIRQVTYTTNDGKTITGNTAADLIADLRRQAWLVEASQGEYVMAVARRVQLWNGATIRTDTAAHTIADLEAAGLLMKGD